MPGERCVPHSLEKLDEGLELELEMSVLVGMRAVLNESTLIGLGYGSPPKMTTAEQIAATLAKKPSEVISMVGNVDDVSEVGFVPNLLMQEY